MITTDSAEVLRLVSYNVHLVNDQILAPRFSQQYTGNSTQYQTT